MAGTRNGDVWLRGPPGKDHDWKCPNCYEKANRGRRLDCWKCHYVPSHKHRAEAKRREQEWLKSQEAKGQKGKEAKPKNGSGGSNGAHGKEAKLQEEVADLQRQLADLKAKAAGQDGANAGQKGNGTEGIDVLDAKIARYEATIAGLLEDGELDMAANVTALLDKAKQQRAEAKAPSSKQQVLNEQRRTKAKLESKRKKHAELVEVVAKAQSDLAAVDEEINELQGQMQKLDQKAQALAAEDAQSGSGAGLLDYVQALKGSCAKRLGDQPGFGQCIDQLEKCAQQIHTELQKADAKAEAKKLEEAQAEAKKLEEARASSANAVADPKVHGAHGAPPDVPMLDADTLQAIVAAACGGADDPDGKRKQAVDDIKAKKLRIRGGPYSG